MSVQRVGCEPDAVVVRRATVQTDRDVNGRYRWSLKAPNGRIVAVSAPVYETAVRAFQGFDRLCSGSADLVVRITHVRGGIGWTWAVPGPDGVPSVCSHRAYERYATCQNAFRRVLVLLNQPELIQRSGNGG
ncbi:DUF1508 domain-containing protein [Kitasatospora sp. NPDC051853]|uniref:DUF1508 domain-containing protein n=1 Tax=Kitasatospora sp. NPDC051853 TaxID=3364058 RepID=UPI0037A7615A